jgi:hypothetical protein
VACNAVLLLKAILDSVRPAKAGRNESGPERGLFS